MEHKDKLLATATSQAQGASSDSIIDRFSNLPDEVAHHILSTLDFKVLVRVGKVSKRGRELYLSTPSLEIVSWSWATKEEQLNLLNSFDSVLNRRGDNKINCLRIDFSLHSRNCDWVFRIITWLHITTRCNVEVLDLDLCVKRDIIIELPSCIFLCRSLRSLSVKCYQILKVPSFTGFSNLQHLNLSDASIDEGFLKCISSTCKCIRELQLKDVRIENITIESSSLESFRYVSRFSHLCHLNISGEKLQRIDIEWGEFHEPGNRSLNVFAPILKYFKWTGNILKRQNLGELICLEEAEILLQYRWNAYGFDNAFEFLSSIRRVKVLILSEKITKVLFQECTVPPPFDNISYLRMHIASLSDDLVPALVSLMKGMSNLNTLHINSDPSLIFNRKPKARGCNRHYWKSQDLNFTSYLKEVRIELSNGFNSMELARYIVEQAAYLEHMVIVYLPCQSYVIKKVTKSKTDCGSTASIVFHKRKLR